MKISSESWAQIQIRSHVARDLLQSAALFKTDKLVVWEYVSNGLQYIDAGTAPIVRVALDSKKKRVSIRDNGRGMDWSDLQNFFVMHGENLDRKAGHAGRGRFGTGKSAAFGIADVLRVTTVRNGKCSQVEIDRRDIESMSAADGVPVRTLKCEIPTREANGTLIEIENIKLRSLDQAGVSAYIERHLARWPKNVSVWIDNHCCEWNEPPVAREERHVAQGAARDILGEATLVLKVAKSPLDEELRGVAIFSKGVWYETTLAGNEGREMSQYIFGEIDVPALDEETSGIQAFDMSRTMKLNAANPLVQAINAFVGQKIEVLRRQLAEVEKQRKAGEEARRLDKQAAEIAQIINQDFSAHRQRIAQVRARASGVNDDGALQQNGGNDSDDLILGTELPAKIVASEGGLGSNDGQSSTRNGDEPRTLNPLVETDEASALQGRNAGSEGDKSSLRGGFRIEFRNIGADAARAEYKRDERTIYINLDHPQFVAAKSLNGVEDAAFRRLSYEVAFAEYSIALASEMAARDEYLEPSDVIVDIRETLNRVARRGAALYER